MFQPYLESGRKEIGVVQRCRGDVDGRGSHGTFIEDLAAACAAELPNDALRRTIDARMAREDLNLAAIERQPGDDRRGAGSTAGGTMTNAGVGGFAGNAEPNRGTKAAALKYLHGLPPKAWDCALRDPQCYQDSAIDNTGVY